MMERVMQELYALCLKRCVDDGLNPYMQILAVIPGKREEKEMAGFWVGIGGWVVGGGGL